MNVKSKSEASTIIAAPGGKVLSIYLNVDQSLPSNRNRGFETSLNDKLRDLESRQGNISDLGEFQRSAEAARQFVRSYQPRARTVSLFARPDGDVELHELDVPVETIVRWLDHPYVQPMLSAQDEFEPLLVVAIDRRHARLVTIALGRAIEHTQLRNAHSAKHVKTAGKDTIKSQPVLDRHRDENLRAFMKDVSKTVDTFVESHSIHRIAIAGTSESAKQLRSFLNKTSRNKVVAFLSIPAKTTVPEIKEAATKSIHAAERLGESAKVDSLLQQAGPHLKAVAGVEATLKAVQEGRVRELVVAESLVIRGGLCPACGGMFFGQIQCNACQTALTAVEDAVDWAVECALAKDATVEQIRGEAATRLLGAGGMGAFLRF